MNNETNDELRPEYDLHSLQIRKLGPGRKRFGDTVRLEPDVVAAFPDAEAVNADDLALGADVFPPEAGDAGFDGPPFERGTGNVREFYAGWMSGNGFPYWPFWENVRSWWGIRHLPNVMLIHFNDMKTDLAGSIRRIAEFLDIPADPAVFPKIVEHCSFGYMRANAEQVTPRGGASWNGGAKTFINKGTNGRWRDVITADEIAAYDAKALAELGPDCARWLASGGPATAG